MCSRCESPLEQKFHEAWLKHPSAKELPELTAQYVIDQHRLDFALVQHQIGIEIDSKEFHSSKEAKQKDRERDNILRSKGWKLIHLYGPDVYWHENSSIEITIFMIMNMFDQYVPARKLIPNGEDTALEKKKTEFPPTVIQLAAMNVFLCFVLAFEFVYESLSGTQVIHSAQDEKWVIVFLFCYLLLPLILRFVHWISGPK